MKDRAASRPSCLTVSLIAIMLGGCGRTPPQTTDEYRREIAAHRRGRVESWSVTDTREAVSERIRYAFMTCFDRVHESCGYTGYAYSCSRVLYHPRAVEEGPSRRTLSIQMETPGTFGPSRRAPPGGVYQLVVDVDADGGGSRVTFYGTTHQYYDRFLLAVRRWSEGLEQPLECPALEGNFRDITETEIPPAAPPPSTSSSAVQEGPQP